MASRRKANNRKRRKKAIKHTLLAILAAFAVVIGVIVLASALLHILGLSRSSEDIAIIDNSTEKIAVTADGSIDTGDTEGTEILGTESSEIAEVYTEPETGFELKETAATVTMEDSDSTYTSTGILLINQDTGDILLQKNASGSIVPTALVKVMSALTAADKLNVTSDTDTVLDETVTVSEESLTWCDENEQSTVGFSAGDTVTVRDLFYGTLVPAGGEAVYELAQYTAGSQEAFTTLMNEKAAELGITSATAFTDPVGLYNETQEISVSDLALVMQAAMDNEFVAKVLASETYTTTNKVEFKNKAYKRMATTALMGETLGMKSGFIEKAGGCCVMSYQSSTGGHFILVTVGATDANVCTKEDAKILKKYAVDTTEETTDETTGTTGEAADDTAGETTGETTGDGQTT